MVNKNKKDWFEKHIEVISLSGTKKEDKKTKEIVIKKLKEKLTQTDADLIVGIMKQTLDKIVEQCALGKISKEKAKRLIDQKAGELKEVNNKFNETINKRNT